MLRFCQTALDLLYPPRCRGCEASGPAERLCDACLAATPPPRSPLCHICGTPFATAAGGDHLCGACLRRRPCFRHARAVAAYEASTRQVAPLNRVLHEYKYQRDVSLAPTLASLLSQRLPFTLDRYDRIVPVPLHPERLRWRGFNQAMLLARRLGTTASRRLDPFVLQRQRATTPQVGLDHDARQRNVAGAFTVRGKHELRGQSVLLIDDVYTTGATVNECARVLRRAGVEYVDVLVVAQALLR